MVLTTPVRRWRLSEVRPTSSSFLPSFLIVFLDLLRRVAPVAKAPPSTMITTADHGLWAFETERSFSNDLAGSRCRSQ